MISIQPNWSVVIGLAITVLLGLGVGCLVRRVSAAIPIPPPNEEPQMVSLWTKLTTQNTGGSYIGHIERPIFFAACWLNVWLLISSWLVFKLAFYWQGANFTAFPPTLPKPEEMAWVVAKRQMGTHHVATALVGTGANIVVALVGVAVGKWIKLQ
jgi:hypothetical protein